MIVSQAQLLEKMTDIGEQLTDMLDKRLEVPDGSEQRLVQAMRYSLFAGGKRLRPFLVMETAKLFDVDHMCALRVAGAIECVHTYSLIHDDLPAMDDDDMRRGKLTLHKEFDEATAILAGDALQVLAFDLLGHENTHPDHRVRIDLVREIAKASGVKGMVGGQMIDLLADGSNFDMAEITRMQQLKTGALICFSAEAGAILGKASKHMRNLLVGYARDLGLAFQITDDLLDLEGKPEEVGKSLGKDPSKGKATFVSAMGADRARQQAKILAEQAIEHIAEFGDRANNLVALAHYVVNRNK